jgi:hypothetical protein
MNGERIYFSDQNLVQENPMGAEGTTNASFQNAFKQFIAEFSKDNIRIYDKLLLNIVQSQQGKYYLPIILGDLKETNEALYEKYISKPLEMLSVMD